MAAPILEFPHKALRAEVILDYVKKAGTFKGIVCITCGAAGDALTDAAAGEVEVVILKPGENDEWITMEQIAQQYPGYFDATSGHLPLWLMQRISEKFRTHIDTEQTHGRICEWEYRVPTGSGETILELMMCVDNECKLIALYDYNRGSKFESSAPLNNIVSKLFPVHFYEHRTRKAE